MQGALETAGVPYVGAGVAASAVAMDKALFKVFLAHAGIPTPEHCGGHGRRVGGPTRTRCARRVAEAVGYPAFCKPARLGSSVGISPVPAADDLGARPRPGLRATTRRRSSSGPSPGREVEVGVLDGEPRDRLARWARSPSRATGTTTRPSTCPGRSSLAGARRPARRRRPTGPASWRCAAFAAVGLRRPGAGRLLRGARRATVLLSELNTMPGFTPTSVYARLMEAAGDPLPRARRPG